MALGIDSYKATTFALSKKQTTSSVKSSQSAIPIAQSSADSFDRFSGLTPLGTQLQQKVIGPLLLGPAQQGTLQKPLLMIIVTYARSLFCLSGLIRACAYSDGEPGGENRDTLVQVLSGAAQQLSRTRYGPDAMSVQLAQVGNDLKARKFLEEIDTHPQVGPLVDCTSNFENEADNMAKANPPVDLT